jgi:hypothetical protein
MLVLLICVQVVQINNNESNWRGKKKTTILYCKQEKDMWTCQESNLVDKIHKEFKVM